MEKETTLFFFSNFKIIQCSVLLISQDAFKGSWLVLLPELSVLTVYRPPSF